MEVWSHQLQWGKLREMENVLWAAQHISEEKENAFPKPFWERLTGKLRWQYGILVNLWMKLGWQEWWVPGRLRSGSRQEVCPSVQVGCLLRSCSSPGLVIPMLPSPFAESFIVRKTAFNSNQNLLSCKGNNYFVSCPKRYFPDTKNNDLSFYMQYFFRWADHYILPSVFLFLD